MAFLLLWGNSVFAQQQKADTSKSFITILHSEYSEYIQENQRAVQRLVGDVQLLHGSDTLYCDSAIFYQSQNAFEAYGDVAIFQSDGTFAYADYVRYTGNNKKVFMNVESGYAQLSDGKENTIWSKELDYNLNSKVGTYRNGGILQSDQTLLSSRRGIYNLNTKNAVFSGNVEVNDPEYRIVTSEMQYNTDSKITIFSAPAIITNEESVLQVQKGWYNAEKRIGHFENRSSVLNKEQYIEADTLDYDKEIGDVKAFGNVIAIDSVQKSTLFSGYAFYNEKSEVFIAYREPIMKKVDTKDTIYIRADTFYSRPIVEADKITAQDSLQATADLLQSVVEKDSLSLEDSSQISQDSMQLTADSSVVSLVDSIMIDKKQENTKAKKEEKNTSVEKKITKSESHAPSFVIQENVDQANKDSGRVAGLSEVHRMDSIQYSYTNRPQANAEDTSKPRLFYAYHHVLIFSDSLQGKCDSLSYSQYDSLMRLYVKPVLWQEKNQILGDSILLQSANQEMKELIVPTNAIMISLSGPPKAEMYDQVQGNEIRGFFKNNKLDSMVAQVNAASIYYAKDDEEAYIGVSEATSNSIEIKFEDGKIKKIFYRKDIEQTMTPMQEAAPAQLKLSRFLWRENERPDSLEKFLNGRILPEEPDLMKMSKKE